MNILKNKKKGETEARRGGTPCKQKKYLKSPLASQCIRGHPELANETLHCLEKKKSQANDSET